MKEVHKFQVAIVANSIVIKISVETTLINVWKRIFRVYIVSTLMVARAHRYSNTIGSYTCSCRTGYSLAANRHSHQGTAHTFHQPSTI
jgi:hypothetical protein